MTQYSIHSLSGRSDDEETADGGIDDSLLDELALENSDDEESLDEVDPLSVAEDKGSEDDEEEDEDGDSDEDDEEDEDENIIDAAFSPDEDAEDIDFDSFDDKDDL